MIFSILVLLLIAGIAFIHYVQGLFSATLSAVLAVLSAVFAVAYHEPIVAAVMKGNMANAAHAIMLVSLFAVTYIVLRLIFDRFVPGNVRFPLMLDKIGAAAMGVVAGIFATGIFAMAAQMLPFGPSVAGYSRNELGEDRSVTVPDRRGRNMDSMVFSELKDPTHFIDPAKSAGMLIPADDLLIKTVNGLSKASLAGERTLDSVHPDWLKELFGQRLGYQPGAKRVAMNLPGKNELSIESVYTLALLEQVDGELDSLREKAPLVKKGGDVLKPAGDQALLVVRGNFGVDASDSDQKLRISTGAVRLVGVSGDGAATHYQNYFPVGTIDDALLYRNRPDDPIIADLSKDGFIDFAFIVNKSDFFKSIDPKSPKLDLKDGVFLEAKRQARVDLSGREVTNSAPTSEKKSQVKRKTGLKAPAEGARTNRGAETRTGGTQSAAPAATNAPLTVGEVKVAAQLFSAVNAGNYSGNPADVTLLSGTATVRDQKFSKLHIEANEAIARLRQGDYAYDALWVPEGKAMVRVLGAPKGDNHWKWAENLSAWELVDGDGNKYQPNGAWSKVKAGTVDKMVAEYNAESPINSISTDSEARPLDVWLAFNVPTGTTIRDVLYEGKSVKKLTLSVQ